MSGDIIARCGVRCDLCPAFRPNLARDPRGREKLVYSWTEYFGVPEGFARKAVCDGCLAGGNAGTLLINEHCRVRRCAREGGYANCGHCDDFVCDKELKNLLFIRRLKDRFARHNLPAEDYELVVAPYDMETTLRAVRKELGKEGRNDYVLSRLLDEDKRPSEAKLRRHVRGEAGEAWTALRRFLKRRYPGLRTGVHFQARHAGWGLRYRAGKKPLWTFFPEGEAFVVHLNANPAALARAGFAWEEFARRPDVYVEDYRRGASGKKIWVRVRGGDELEYVKPLLAAKATAKAKRGA